MPWTLLIYAALALGAYFGGKMAWTGFKEGIAAPYVQAQQAKDAEALGVANENARMAEGRAKAREAEAAEAVSAAAAQSKAVEEAQEIAKQASAAARVQAQKYAALVAANAERDKKLKALALSAPKAQSCEDTLAQTDAILRESARISQGLSK